MDSVFYIVVCLTLYLLNTITHYKQMFFVLFLHTFLHTQSHMLTKLKALKVKLITFAHDCLMNTLIPVQFQ